MRIIGAVAIAALLSACEQEPQNPSPESEALQHQIIPRLVQWSEGSSPELKLFEAPGVSSFDHLCYQDEYQDISKMRNVDIQIKEYRGHAGYMVPENYTAVIGVKDDVGHVAYLDAKYLRIGGPVRCPSAKKVVVIRDTAPGTPWQRADFN